MINLFKTPGKNTVCFYEIEHTFAYLVLTSASVGTGTDPVSECFRTMEDNTHCVIEYFSTMERDREKGWCRVAFPYSFLAGLQQATCSHRKSDILHLLTDVSLHNKFVRC